MPKTSDGQPRMFVLQDGSNAVLTFALVSSLFLLWGFCNGMIDVMDKHFQQELHLSLAQSAWVQFAHYLGYFLMALPAGWLATRPSPGPRPHREEGARQGPRGPVSERARARG